MTLIQMLVAGGALAAFVWLLIPSKRPRGGSGSSSPADVGLGTGMMGGDIEDACIAQHALDRSRGKGKPTTRDLGQALGLQDSAGDG